MRVSGMLALALVAVVLVGCTDDQETQVLGVVLESPSPTRAAAPAPRATGPDLGGPDALPGGSATPTATSSPVPAPPRTASPRQAAGPATAPATAGPAERVPSPTPDPGWRLPTTDGESGTVWHVAETDDGAGGTRRVWVETSSTVLRPSGSGAPTRMPLRTGLRMPDDDGSAPVRDARCTAAVHPDPEVDVVVDGTVLHELVVDGEVVASASTGLSLTVRAGSGPAIASALGPVEVALDDTDTVACRVSFVAAG